MAALDLATYSNLGYNFPMHGSNALVAREVLHFMRTRGLTQAALAGELGMRQATLSRKLTGVRAWSLDDIDALGRIGVPVSLASFVPMEV